ncbi:MAG: DUF2721 domain-containing protein [Erythrobacter sp.]
MTEVLFLLGLPSAILERTASTPQTLAAVQLSLAPAFLLVGIGSIMNVMMARLTWIAGRIERLTDVDENTHSPRTARELAWLGRRRHFVRRAMLFSTAAAGVISVVIAVLFVSVYIEPRIGTLVAFLWVLTMVLLILGLSQFFAETSIAARGSESFSSRNDRATGGRD